MLSVKLGIANSRLKDYYDLYIIGDNHKVDISQLAEAIERTFERRETEVNETIPVGLSEDFCGDEINGVRL